MNKRTVLKTLLILGVGTSLALTLFLRPPMVSDGTVEFRLTHFAYDGFKSTVEFDCADDPYACGKLYRASEYRGACTLAGMSGLNVTGDFTWAGRSREKLFRVDGNCSNEKTEEALLYLLKKHFPDWEGTQFMLGEPMKKSKYERTPYAVVGQ